MTAAVCQQYWEPRVAEGRTPVCTPRDPERVLCLAPALSKPPADLPAQAPSRRQSYRQPRRSGKAPMLSHSLWLVLLNQRTSRRNSVYTCRALESVLFQPLLLTVLKLCCQHRGQGRDTHIDTPGDPETSLYATPAPAATYRDTSPAQPGLCHTHPRVQCQACRLQSWLWTLKQPWGLIPCRDHSRTTPTWASSNKPTNSRPYCRPSHTALHLVLTQNTCNSRCNPISSGSRWEKVFTFWIQSVKIGRGIWI